MAGFTQEQIDALKEAIASGVRVVRHNETTTAYQSIQQMKDALAIMQAEVNGVPRRTVAKFTRGR